MITITESYDIVTNESAINGETAEDGWLNEEGNEYENVEEAIHHLKNEGVIEASASDFHQGIWYKTEEEQDMYNGSYETRYFFIKNASFKEEKQIYEGLFGKKPKNIKVKVNIKKILKSQEKTLEKKSKKVKKELIGLIKKL